MDTDGLSAARTLVHRGRANRGARVARSRRFVGRKMFGAFLGSSARLGESGEVRLAMSPSQNEFCVTATTTASSSSRGRVGQNLPGLRSPGPSGTANGREWTQMHTDGSCRARTSAHRGAGPARSASFNSRREQKQHISICSNRRTSRHTSCFGCPSNTVPCWTSGAPGLARFLREMNFATRRPRLPPPTPADGWARTYQACARQLQIEPRMDADRRGWFL